MLQANKPSASSLGLNHQLEALSQPLTMNSPSETLLAVDHSPAFDITMRPLRFRIPGFRRVYIGFGAFAWSTTRGCESTAGSYFENHGTLKSQAISSMSWLQATIYMPHSYCIHNASCEVALSLRKAHNYAII